MLYDPSKEPWQKAKSFDRFIEWLETFPPEREYCFCKIQTCLITQWLLSHGIPQSEAELKGASIMDVLGAGFYFVAIRTSGFGGNDTFGGALKRAKGWRDGSWHGHEPI